VQVITTSGPVPGGPTVCGTVYAISNATDLPIVPCENTTSEALCGAFNPVGTADIEVTTAISPFTLTPGSRRDVNAQNGCTLYLLPGTHTVCGTSWGVIIAPGTSINLGRNFTHYGRFVGETIGSDFNDNVTYRDCTSAAPVERSSWSTIKALYR